MRFISKVCLFLSFFFISTAYADNMYFQITQPPKPQEKIIIWSMMHSEADLAMNFTADDAGIVMCESPFGIACSTFQQLAMLLTSYNQLWNKIATCPSKENWQLYVEVQAAGGNKTYDLPTLTPEQVKNVSNVLKKPTQMIMKPISNLKQ